MELMDEQEMIRKAYFDATQASCLPPQWIYEFALNLLAAHSAGAQEPVAWMYQSEDPLDGGEWFLSDTKPNRRNIRPLYTHPQPMPQTDASRHLSDLLARIHRDGGHYETQYGTEKATADAEMKVAQLNEMTDAARGVKRWREKIIQAMRAPSRGDFTIAINAIVREMTTEIERLARTKGEYKDPVDDGLGGCMG